MELLQSLQELLQWGSLCRSWTSKVPFLPRAQVTRAEWQGQAGVTPPFFPIFWLSQGAGGPEGMVGQTPLSGPGSPPPKRCSSPASLWAKLT